VGTTPEGGGAPADEARLLDELGRLGVVDVLVSAAATIAQITYVRLDERHRDLDEARRAIDALQRLVGAVAAAGAEDVARDVRQTIANLQLHYAETVETEAPSEG